MRKLLIFSFLFQSIGISYFAAAQKSQSTRPIEALLIDTAEGWSRVKRWIDSASNTVQVLPADKLANSNVLYEAQVSTRSPMGAIIYNTGGILVDHGWIRILGGKSSEMKRTIVTWNNGRSLKDEKGNSLSYLIADDVLGGLFAINGGGLGEDVGNVYYFGPENLSWQPLSITYTDFLNFCFNGNLNQFYEGFRWQNWQQEIRKIDPDEVFTFFPPLWASEWSLKESKKEIQPIDNYFSQVLLILNERKIVKDN